MTNQNESSEAKTCPKSLFSHWHQWLDYSQVSAELEEFLLRLRERAPVDEATGNPLEEVTLKEVIAMWGLCEMTGVPFDMTEHVTGDVSFELPGVCVKVASECSSPCFQADSKDATSGCRFLALSAVDDINKRVRYVGYVTRGEVEKLTSRKEIPEEHLHHDLPPFLLMFAAVRQLFQLAPSLGHLKLIGKRLGKDELIPVEVKRALRDHFNACRVAFDMVHEE